MEKLTAQQIKEKLEKLNIEMDDFAYNFFDVKEIIGNHYIVYDARIGGDYDIQKNVIYFEYHDIYLSIEGYYSSYDGADFSNNSWVDIKEVKPVDKVITVYE